VCVADEQVALRLQREEDHGFERQREMDAQMQADEDFAMRLQAEASVRLAYV
jgi:hypothetical protein